MFRFNAMKFTLNFLTLIFLLSPFVGFSQIHLEGEVKIVMKEGLISGDLRLSNIPEVKGYNILLNKGMNIQYFQNSENQVMPYSGYYNGKMRGEALAYTFIDDQRTLQPLPDQFSIKYRGAFPVYTDTLNSFDFKGLIAFNGNTLRAAEQSKWYPVIYDIANDRIIDNYTFSIRINCEDCHTVFINGAMPSPESNSLFESAIPRQLMLYTGDYTFMESRGNFILNADLDTITAERIFGEIELVKEFYADKMNMPYDEKIYLISHKAITPYRPDQSWGFAIFPTFAYAGVDFKTLINESGKFEPANFAFFAHELAHYYFNTGILSGTEGWFWLESTAEYLSLKASENFFPNYYKSRLKSYAEFLLKKKYKPIKSIKSMDEIDEDYRYVFGPLILIVFEKEFGQKVTFNILSDLVRLSESKSITFDDFRYLAMEEGITPEAYGQFEEVYLTNPLALQNTINSIMTQP